METNAVAAKTDGSWDGAVRWLREQPEQPALIRDPYCDDGREIAARFGRIPALPRIMELFLKMPVLGEGLIRLAGLLDNRTGRLHSFVARRG